MFRIPEKDRPRSKKAPCPETYADLYVVLQKDIEWHMAELARIKATVTDWNTETRYQEIERKLIGLQTQARAIWGRALVLGLFSYHVRFPFDKGRRTLKLYPRELFGGFARRAIKRGDTLFTFQSSRRRYEAMYMKDGIEIPLTGEGAFQRDLRRRELRILEAAMPKAALAAKVKEH